MYTFLNCTRQVVKVALPAATITAFALGNAIKSTANNESNYESQNQMTEENLAVFIKSESKKSLEEFLEDWQISSTGSNMVCFARAATAEQRYVYRPLFGQRAAFRLKGLIITGEGTVIGTGRVSTMMGEMKEGEYEAAFPLYISRTGSVDFSAALSIPSRVRKVQRDQEQLYWSGALSQTQIGERDYPSVSSVTFLPIPHEKQVVLEGTICSNRYVAKDGVACEYDSELVSEAELLEEEMSQKNKHAPNRLEDAASANVGEVDDGETCPLCRYMKAGPCKAEFLKWDECVQSIKADEHIGKCFSVTCGMMNCMRNYEYYDIMTAGVDYSKMNETEAAAKKETEENTSSRTDTKDTTNSAL